MRYWRRIGPLLAVVLVFNVVAMVSVLSVAVAQERPSLTYFALGDSYASGHGLQDDGTPCRRSSLAYPYRVKDALRTEYEEIDFHHYACSGATAGPNTEDERRQDDFKSISEQFEEVNRQLEDRDGMDPVLVTITIGANDIGLLDPDTWGQISRRPNLNARVAAAVAGFRISPLVGVATGVVAALPTTSAVGFFEWLDAESATIYSALTPGIDNLLAHENVYILLTDYPNPLPNGAFEGWECNDIFGSLTCGEAVRRVVQRLNSVMVDQFLTVNQPGRLRVAALGSNFSSHPIEMRASVSWPPVGCLTGAVAPNTWFQGDCAHPNDQGAQGIADVVVDMALTLLPTPTTAQPIPSESGTGGLTVQFWDIRNNVPDTTSQCVQLVGATEVLCANDFPDGQIQMNGIPAGTYEVCVTRFYPDVPGEPVWAWFRSPASVTIAPGSHETITLNLYMDFEPGERTLCGFDDTASASGSSADSAQRTWTASVQVSLCDASSNGGTCQAGAGITVDISLASGEWMGSCTTSEPMPTPWDVYISTCTVEGLPYHEDFVATQDPSTIPEGYAPANDPQTLHVEDIHPGGGDQATFMFTNVRADAGASTSVSPGTSAPAGESAPTEAAVPSQSTGTTDPMSLLPAIADVPGGLVETGRRARSLEEVAGNYTDPAETTQLFTDWGWQGNAVASFALPAGQEAQGGQVNGVYVSIHQFADADAARAALDFSLTEQAVGTVLQEITTGPLGEYTRALYGPMDYGNETTVLVQQGSVFIRVSVAMLDGDPTGDAVAVTEAILLNVTAPQATTVDQDTSGATSSGDGATAGSEGGGAQAIVPIEPEGAAPSSAASPQQTSNVVISTVISGYPFLDACYVLVGYSDVACVELPDTVVRFYDVPLGTYTVRQTADLGPGQWVDDFTIQVTGSGEWEGFEANVNMADSSSSTLAGQALNLMALARGNDRAAYEVR